MKGHDPGLALLWRLAGSALVGVLVVATVAALSDWRPAGWLLVGGVAALVGAHLAISIVSYRRTMRRPWPKVRPVPDDDDW